MDTNSPEGRPLCCMCKKVPLTVEEESKKKICYICTVEGIKKFAEASHTDMGTLKLPVPEEYGRTQVEIDKLLKQLNPITIESLKPYAKVLVDDVEVVDGLSWTPEDRKELMLKFGFDPAKKPLTRIITKTDESTRLIFEIPEYVSDENKEEIRDTLTTTLLSLIRYLTYGQHLDSTEPPDIFKGDNY